MSEKTFKIFIAGPSDVDDYKVAVIDVIRELNERWSFALPAKYIPVTSSIGVLPGVGKHPQDVISAALDKSISVFVAVFWSRIGTPTDKSISGTIEEFEIALSLFRQHSKPSIHLYFCRASYPPDIDAEQIDRVQDFSRSVSKEGVKYEVFTEMIEFERHVRINIAQATWDYLLVERDPEISAIDEKRDESKKIIADEIPLQNPYAIRFSELLLLSIERFVIANEYGTRLSKELNSMSSSLDPLIDRLERATHCRDRRGANRIYIQLGKLFGASAMRVATLSTIQSKHIKHGLFFLDFPSGNKPSKLLTESPRLVNHVVAKIEKIAHGANSIHTTYGRLISKIKLLPSVGPRTFNNGKRELVKSFEKFTRQWRDIESIAEEIVEGLQRYQ